MNFQVDEATYYISYTKDLEKGKKLYLCALKQDKLPILGTNLLGTIKVTKEGFAYSFSNVLEINDKSYLLKFKRSLVTVVKVNDKEVTFDGNIYTQSEENKNVFTGQDDSTVLFQLVTEEGEAYYLGKKVKENTDEVLQ